MTNIIPISINQSIKDLAPMNFEPIGEACQLRWDIQDFLKSLGAQITGGGCGVLESDIEFEHNGFRYQLFVKCSGETE